MARKKQIPKNTKKRVAFTTISPTVREQYTSGFAPPTTLPSETTWNNMMKSVDAKYNTDHSILDKYEEPTSAQWDAIEAADPRYKRPKSSKKTKTKVKKKASRKKNKTPPRSKKQAKMCLTLMQIARAFPDIARQVCFHPKVSSFKSLMGISPAAKKKVATFL